MIRLSSTFEAVQDADEEVFILYSEKQLSKSTRGLGYVDSHKDVLEISFELTGVSPASNSDKPRHRKQKAKEPNKTIEIELHQDKTALRSRKGDTGSVVWQASIDFAQLVLQQHYARSEQSIFLPEAMAEAHVLELGAGTGLLSIALSPLVRQYTATDISPLIPLIRKNVISNTPNNTSSNVSVEELDWVTLQSAPPALRNKIYNPEERPIDLLLVVDCLYHPSLVPPFISTIDYLATPGKTAVLIVSELRAEDVLRDFLEAWLSKPGWEIFRIPNDDLGKHYAIWLGYKKDVDNGSTQ